MKSWIEKRDSNKSYQVKIIDKKFADINAGSKMFIATPKIIDDYVRSLGKGISSDIPTMRNDLALEYNADKTCPVTASIFLRIVSEAALEEFDSGKDIDDITPFWRAINPNSPIAKKLSCGVDFVLERRALENIY